MEFMLDSANLEEIKKVKDLGLLGGLTTNPIIIQKGLTELAYKGNFFDYAKRILELTEDKPCFFQVATQFKEQIINQARSLYESLKSFGNVHIKVPINTSLAEGDSVYEGFSAIRELNSKNVPILATAIVTPVQAYLASVAGAKYAVLMLRPYDNIIAENLEIGDLGESGYLTNKRVLDEMTKRNKSLDNYLSGEETLRRAGKIFKDRNLATKLLIAGIRNPVQASWVMETGGVSAITMPYKVFRSLFSHEGTKRFVIFSAVQNLPKFEIEISKRTFLECRIFLLFCRSGV
ncbi:MAG TPA: transaldolase family protein [Candidatus Nanoarchaeia archaeon]|nr:hypothetical protein [Candidatus Woesearchaeota archaeon]HLD11192.1 transaldolase family protein [Candidatus Nanoarchaeia archaeon]